MSEEFGIPELDDDELEWLSTVLAALTPKRAVALFLHQFDRFLELDADIPEIKEQLRIKFRYYKNTPGSSLYKTIQANRKFLHRYENKVLKAYSLFNKIEQWTVMQEMFIGVREIDSEVLRLLKDASKITAEEYNVPMEDVEVDAGEPKDNPYAIEMETGDGTERDETKTGFGEKAGTET